MDAGRMTIASIHLSLAKLLWSKEFLASRSAASYRQVGCLLAPSFSLEHAQTSRRRVC